MHELGIVFHVIKTVERVGAENDLTRVAGVTLELGEVCGAIPKELVSCWDWAVQKSDLLRGAQLHIETLPAVTQCGGCGREYPTGLSPAARAEYVTIRAGRSGPGERAAMRIEISPVPAPSAPQ